MQERECTRMEPSVAGMAAEYSTVIIVPFPLAARPPADRMTPTAVGRMPVSDIFARNPLRTGKLCAIAPKRSGPGTLK